MNENRLYFGIFGLLILIAGGYLIFHGLALYQLFISNGFLLPFEGGNRLETLKLLLPTGFALATLLCSGLAIGSIRSFAYLAVASFALMYLSREIISLMLMYQGSLAEPFYNFSFLYLGFIMLLEMAALWLIPRHSEFKTNQQ